MDLFDMSIYASILIVAIVFVRQVGIHRIPKRFYLLFWSIVIIRLLIPFTITSPIPLPKQMPIDMSQHFSTDLLQVDKTNKSPFFLIWILGMGIAFIRFMSNYLRGYRKLSTSLPVNDAFIHNSIEDFNLLRTIQVRQSDQILTPLAYGIIHPVIVFPKTIDWDDKDRLSYILIHELIHIQRFDAVMKHLLAATVCVHWFNPFVRIMYVLANRDIELSCDEAVIRKIGQSHKAAYALTLIDMSSPNKKPVMPFHHFSKYAIEERIEAITKKRKVSVCSFCMITTILILSIFAFTSSYIEPDYNPLALDENNPVQEILNPLDTPYIMEDKSNQVIDILSDLNITENVPGQVIDIVNDPNILQEFPSQSTGNSSLIEGSKKE